MEIANSVKIRENINTMKEQFLDLYADEYTMSEINTFEVLVDNLNIRVDADRDIEKTYNTGLSKYIASTNTLVVSSILAFFDGTQIDFLVSRELALIMCHIDKDIDTDSYKGVSYKDYTDRKCDEFSMSLEDLATIKATGCMRAMYDASYTIVDSYDISRLQFARMNLRKVYLFFKLVSIIPFAILYGEMGSPRIMVLAEKRTKLMHEFYRLLGATYPRRMRNAARM